MINTNFASYVKIMTNSVKFLDFFTNFVYHNQVSVLSSTQEKAAREWDT